MRRHFAGQIGNLAGEQFSQLRTVAECQRAGRNRVTYFEHDATAADVAGAFR